MVFEIGSGLAAMLAAMTTALVSIALAYIKYKTDSLQKEVSAARVAAEQVQVVADETREGVTEIHTIVNSQRTEMKDEIAALKTEVLVLHKMFDGTKEKEATDDST